MRQLSTALLALSVCLFSCTDYGKKVTKDFLEVYYKDGVSKDQAERTADFLYPYWKSPDGEKTSKKSIQLSQSGDTILFRMVSDMSKMSEVGDATFATMAQTLSDSLYSNAPVNIVFTDNKFKSIRVLTYKKAAANATQEKVVISDIEVYYEEGFDKEQATQLAEFLNNYFGRTNNGQTKSFHINQEADGHYVLKMSYRKEVAAKIDDKDFYDVARTVSDSVFAGAPLELFLTDGNFEPFKAFRYKTGDYSTEP